MKYLVVTGGVVSGLGKGISISSLGVLLKACGLRVTAIKIDPYLNSDAGTMSPFEHGEVFVLNDGGEADLDLGNYERFLDITLTRDHNITTGKVYSQVIAAERRGDYLGKTVQVIPHVTDAIQDWIERVSTVPVGDVASATFTAADGARGGGGAGSDSSSSAAAASSGGGDGDEAMGGAGGAAAGSKRKAGSMSTGSAEAAGGAGASGTTRPPKAARMEDEGDGEGASASGGDAGASAYDPPDVCLVEVGGTVGDIESLVFLEALRQLQGRVGHDNVCFVHVSLVPVLGSVGEQKTKPTQHSVKELRSVGLSPDVLICRSTHALTPSTRSKLGHFCQVPAENVLTVHDVSNIYHVPLMLNAQGAAQIIAQRLKLSLPFPTPRLGLWRGLAESVDAVSNVTRIALVGKYTGLQDSYLSVVKALQHAAVASSRRLVIDWVDAAALEPNVQRTDPTAYAESWATVRASDGILVPGGFGDRGVEGKILAITEARTTGKPFLGICLGMQCAVIEYARNVLGLSGANSAEFDASAPHKLVIFMPEISTSHMGGTMRLGSRPTILRGRADGAPSLARDVYGRDVKVILERHRHRYEVNPDHVAALQAAGLFFTGVCDKGQRMEVVELDRKTHPYFIACQYHPEFQSHPFRPSPPFHGFLLAASGQLEGRLPLSAADRRAKGLAVGGGAAGGASSSSGSAPGSARSSGSAGAALAAASLLAADKASSSVLPSSLPGLASASSTGSAASASASGGASSLSSQGAVIGAWEKSPLRAISTSSTGSAGGGGAGSVPAPLAEGVMGEAGTGKGTGGRKVQHPSTSGGAQ